MCYQSFIKYVNISLVILPYCFMDTCRIKVYALYFSEFLFTFIHEMLIQEEKFDCTAKRQG